MRAPGKPLERVDSIRKNAGICAKTHGLRLLPHKVSNLHLGSFRAKSQRGRLTIIFEWYWKLDIRRRKLYAYVGESSPPLGSV